MAMPRYGASDFASPVRRRSRRGVLALLTVAVVCGLVFAYAGHATKLGGGIVKFIPDSNFRIPAQIVEGAKGMTISCDLPGVKKDDIEISLQDSKLTIAGNRKSAAEEGMKLVHQETFVGTLTCAFEIPDSIDLSNIQANHENGVLTLTLFKKPEAKPRIISIA
eukprot:314124-Amorphochlora_amoeboformis.AAC.1